MQKWQTGCSKNPWVRSSSGGSSSQVILGNTTVGGTDYNSSQYRGLAITPAENVSITHGYYYGRGSGLTVQLGIYNASTQAQVGSCSSTENLPATNGWVEVTWSTPVSLTSGTTYRLQNHSPSTGFLWYAADEVGGGFYGASHAQCGTFYTSTSSRYPSMYVATYDAA